MRKNHLKGFIDRCKEDKNKGTKYKRGFDILPDGGMALFIPHYRSKAFHKDNEEIFRDYEVYCGRKYHGYVKCHGTLKAAIKKNKREYEVLSNVDKTLVFRERSPEEIEQMKKKKRKTPKSPTLSGCEGDLQSPGLQPPEPSMEVGSTVNIVTSAGCSIDMILNGIQTPPEYQIKEIMQYLMSSDVGASSNGFDPMLPQFEDSEKMVEQIEFEESKNEECKTPKSIDSSPGSSGYGSDLQSPGCSTWPDTVDESPMDVDSMLNVDSSPVSFGYESSNHLCSSGDQTSSVRIDETKECMLQGILSMGYEGDLQSPGCSIRPDSVNGSPIKVDSSPTSGYGSENYILSPGCPALSKEIYKTTDYIAQYTMSSDIELAARVPESVLPSLEDYEKMMQKTELEAELSYQKNEHLELEDIFTDNTLNSHGSGNSDVLATAALLSGE